MVISSRENAQVVGSGDGSSVEGVGVSDGSRVVGDRSLLDIITSAGTGKEAILTNNGVDVGSRTLEQVEEGSAVEVGLLEMQVELCAFGLSGREERAQDLGLETLGDGVIQLNLGVKSVDGAP